ncbi:hypothetical protein RND71_013125 [Anisodus tanguticus]|uniref:non-specific serine/threonine protein kinase n=1 Tax=Anisodus tanguticus TaxID=243964 RepID=A0AAE1SH92_9SOLA|nr:hypothetical protein RND71_013125 [Anisodus tanguticus]
MVDKGEKSQLHSRPHGFLAPLDFWGRDEKGGASCVKDWFLLGFGEDSLVVTVYTHFTYCSCMSIEVSLLVWIPIIELKMPSASPDPTDEEREPFAEADPCGKFGRYAELLGHGAVKKVYRAFDLEEGRDVAWNQIKLSEFSDTPYIISKIHSEIELLKNLKNDNIIVLYMFGKTMNITSSISSLRNVLLVI